VSYILALLGGYLLGSIPFGLLLARMAGQGDIRDIGSGNIGATNVLRTGNKKLALATLLLDASKAGVAALLAAHFLGYPFGLFAAAAALIGHCFPVWLGFKGGKGVATFFGGLLATALPVFLVAALTWFFMAATTRYSSLAALTAAIVAPIAAFIAGFQGVAIMAAVMAFVIFIRHGENISRLRAGSESKIGNTSK